MCSQNKIVEELCNPERVIELCRQHRMLMEDDQLSLRKITEYGLGPNKDSKHPLSEQIDYLIGQDCVSLMRKEEIRNWFEEQGFTQRLGYEAYGSVNDAFKRSHELVWKELMKKEDLGHRVREVEDQLDAKSKELDATRITLAELERSKKYEDLSDEQIQKLKETVQRLKNEIGDLKFKLFNLSLQVDRQNEIIFNLQTKTRETVKEYLARMNTNEMWKLIIDAIWGKIDPLVAQVLKSDIVG